MTAKDRPANRSLRLDPWPGDASVGHLIVLDQQAVPDPEGLPHWIAMARARGHRRLRTSALFPDAARTMADAGFRTVDTLALLRLDLRRAATPRHDERHTVHHRVRRLPRRDDPLAAAVDAGAFGVASGNDTAGIRAIRSATPRHRARAVRSGSSLVGYAIGGVGARSGYLQRLAVDPGHRRQGIAGALVEDLVQWFAALGLDDVLVNTGVDNEAALGLYLRRGFTILDHRLVVTELDLSAPSDGPAQREPVGTETVERATRTTPVDGR